MVTIEFMGTWQDMTWQDMTWHEMTWQWHDMTWHDMTWHDLTWHFFAAEHDMEMPKSDPHCPVITLGIESEEVGMRQCTLLYFTAIHYMYCTTLRCIWLQWNALYCIGIRKSGGKYSQIYPYAWKSSRGWSLREILKAEGHI